MLKERRREGEEERRREGEEERKITLDQNLSFLEIKAKKNPNKNNQ